MKSEQQLMFFGVKHLKTQFFSQAKFTLEKIAKNNIFGKVFLKTKQLKIIKKYTNFKIPRQSVERKESK